MWWLRPSRNLYAVRSQRLVIGRSICPVPACKRIGHSSPPMDIVPQTETGLRYSVMQRVERCLCGMHSAPEREVAVHKPGVRDECASTRMEKEPESLTSDTAADKSGLVPAGLPIPASEDAQGDSPHPVEAMDESCDLRTKSPVAVVEV